MLLVADPDRAEGASTHNLEDGQRNGRRELFRNVTENKNHPRRHWHSSPRCSCEIRTGPYPTSCLTVPR